MQLCSMCLWLCLDLQAEKEARKLQVRTAEPLSHPAGPEYKPWLQTGLSCFFNQSQGLCSGRALLQPNGNKT